MRKRLVAAFAALLGLWGVMHLSAEPLAVPDQRARAQKLFNEGNFKEALTIFRSLALLPENNDPRLSNDIVQVVNCYQNLQLLHEIDGFLDQAEEVHPANWRALKTIGQQWSVSHHYGFVVAGKFRRGNNGGEGQYVDSTPRDRARSLQLYVKALPLIQAEAVTDQNRGEVAEFYRQFGDFLLNGRWSGSAWQLQSKTDLTKLPDYDSPHYGRWGGHGVSKGAPVDADGNPVFYTIPESFEAATSDGQRWRWAMEQVRKVDPASARQVDRQFADFLQTQFGVQTLREGGISLPDDDATEGEKEANPFAVKTLKDEETIARLATGAKRLTLPDEFNPIAILKRLSDGNDTYASQGTRDPGPDRRRTASSTTEGGRLLGPGDQPLREYQRHSPSSSLDQIVGQLGPVRPDRQSQPAGTRTPRWNYIFP
jgi:tetratricopeptide (TPR) repeat protein